ncbi:uncharacterized protein DUF4091 [Nonomuraea fuscirosea]|uniref:Uncharacterized protein DUF4091 n=1 Tax=Nonomuraea fuscirosea TaxID=1291556 RepID=A0A2T0M1Z6_9ACTN|nr:uncharacterized protein DUF4091 [Nonomuraea fuscirosea]
MSGSLDRSTPPNHPTRRQFVAGFAAASVTFPLLPADSARAALASLTVWLPASTDKVRRDRAIPADRGARISLQAARNEYESGQIIVRTAAGSAQVGVSSTALTGPGGATIPSSLITFYEQRYVEVPRSEDNPKYFAGWYPDALVPLTSGATVTATASQNAAVWFTVKIPEGQAPGVYSGTITLTGGDAPVTIPLSMDVWNFEVPDAPSFDTSCAIWYPQVGAAHGLTWGTAAYDRMMRTYWDFQAGFRLAGADIPIRGNPGPPVPGYPPGPGPDPDPAAFLAHAEEYLTDPRIRKYRIPLYTTGDNNRGFQTDTAKLRQVVAGLQGLGLLDRGFFYYADEPTEDVHYQHVKNLFALVDTIAPDVPHVLTLTGPPRQDLLDFVRAWAFVVTAPKPELPNLVQALRARGDLVWWYTAWGHNFPTPSVFIHDSLVGTRLLPWIQKYMGIEGYLFWSTTVFGTYDGTDYYRSTQNWQDRWTNPNPLWDFSGDGYFLYPGRQVGVDGPIGSIRLHGLREGFEDAEYLVHYEKRAAAVAEQWNVTFDAKTALRSYHDVLHDWLEPYQDDPALFGRIRAQVGAEVAQLHGDAPTLVHIGRPTAHHVPVTVHIARGATLSVDGVTRARTGGNAAADSYELILDLTQGRKDVSFSVSANGVSNRFTRTIQVNPVATPHEIIINSFESDADVGRVKPTNVTVTRSDQHASAGRSSARMVFAANADNAGAFFYTLHADHPEWSIGRNDWSTFDAVEMDVYNDSDDLVVMQLNFYDPVHFGGDNPFYLSPRKSHAVRVPLTNLPNNLAEITSMELRAPRRAQPLTLYVDNVRFTRSRTGLPSPGTWLRQDGRRRPALHVARTDGGIAMARQAGADPAVWEFTNASDEGLRGPVTGTVASALDPGARLNLIAATGAGQPLQWSREQTPGGTWRRWLLDLTPDNGTRPSLTGHPAAALDINGRLTYCSRTTDGFLVLGRQDAPGSETWRSTYLTSIRDGGRVRVTGDPALVQDPSGKLTFFAQSTGGQLLHGWQLTPGDAQWNTDFLHQNGTGAAAVIAGLPAVSQTIAGRLTFHARDTSGRMVHGWQSTPGNGPWRWDFLPLTTNVDDGGSHVTVTIAGNPAVTLDPSGRLVYFARTTDGRVFHSWQRHPDEGPWDATLIRVAGSPITVAGDGAAAQDATGRVHYFARTAAGALRHAWQDAPGLGPWHAAELGSGIAL